MEAVRGGTAMENAATIRGILAGKKGAPRDIVVANAAAALVAADVAISFLEGANMARAALDSGAAEAKLAALVAFTKLER